MDEALFKQKLDALTRKAREQGLCISIEDVNAAFPEYSEDEEKMGHIHAFLKSQKIAVGDEEAVKQYLSMEDRNYLEAYLEELKNLEIRSDEEMNEIAMAAVCQDEDALGEIMQQFLPKVVELAQMYTGQGVLLEDLIGEGNLALADSVSQLGCLEGEDHAFEEVQGFLGKKMMDAMENLINQEFGEKNTDQEIVNKVNEVADAARKLSEELRRKVSPEEICAESDLTMDDIREAISLSAKCIEDIDYGQKE